MSSRVGGREWTIERNSDKDRDARIAELTRELAETINEGQASGRTELRDYAIDMLRDSVSDEVVASRPEGGGGEASSPAALMNPFALGIPVLLVGVVLTPLFTPVGIAMVAIGLVLCLVGVVLAMARSLRARWSGRG